MQLNKNHRGTLLEELSKAKEEFELEYKLSRLTL